VAVLWRNELDWNELLEIAHESLKDLGQRTPDLPRNGIGVIFVNERVPDNSIWYYWDSTGSLVFYISIKLYLASLRDDFRKTPHAWKLGSALDLDTRYGIPVIRDEPFALDARVEERARELAVSRVGYEGMRPHTWTNEERFCLYQEAKEDVLTKWNEMRRVHRARSQSW
jgi:hypothetical protein